MAEQQFQLHTEGEEGAAVFDYVLKLRLHPRHNEFIEVVRRSVQVHADDTSIIAVVNDMFDLQRVMAEERLELMGDALGSLQVKRMEWNMLHGAPVNPEREDRNTEDMSPAELAELRRTARRRA